MRITVTKTREQIAEARRIAYLEKWPPNKQLEAHADAARGDSSKLDAMLTDFAAIKDSLPYITPS